MSFHSRLSPSGAPKYLHCTKAPSMEDGLPDVTSVYAARGTLGHWVAEQSLRDGGDPTRFAEKWYFVDDDQDPYEVEPGPIMDGQRIETEDKKGFYFYLTTAYCESMLTDLRETRELAEDGELHIEVRVPLDFPLGPGESGTADIIVRAADGDIYVRDWKFGEGIVVEAQDNEQLSLYALGAIQKFWPDIDPATTVHVDVLQPLVGDGGGDRWTTTAGHLYEWAERVVKPAVAEIHNPETAKFAPSYKACMWCKAKNGDPETGRPPCPARRQKNLEIARMAMPDLDAAVELGLPCETEIPADPDVRTLLYILDNAAMFKSWLTDVHDMVYDDLRTGRRPVPGKKLVYGRRGHRAYIDSHEEEVKEILTALMGDQATTVKLKSPAQVQDALGTEIYDLLVAPHVTQPTAKAVIVDESNPKPALLSDREVLTKT